jgi:hypothetical protein
MEELLMEESKNLRWARYDSETRALIVDFKNKAGEKQSTYRYDGVPPEIWDALKTSISHGSFFAAMIRNAMQDGKPKYTVTKVWP